MNEMAEIGLYLALFMTIMVILIGVIYIDILKNVGLKIKLHICLE